MTQLAPTHTHSFRQAHAERRAPSVVGRLMRAPLRWAAQTLARHRDERLLQGMTDTQLRDIGIMRGQIPRVIRDGFYR